MAIDVSVFGADLPAGTYTKGDVVPLKNISGPAVVRSGRGSALLKRITSLELVDISGSTSKWLVYVKNSDWVDPTTSVAVPMTSPTALDRRTGAVQAGHNCDLTPNSTWEVYAVAYDTVTTTVDNALAVTIEVDYPQVAAIIEPDNLTGIPASIVQNNASVPLQAISIENATWTRISTDFFKAGYQYALEKLEMCCDKGASGFISLSNAAGMGGLTRIIPISQAGANIRPLIEYASTLVKGPLDIGFMLFNAAANTATTGDVNLVFDFVKRRM